MRASVNRSAAVLGRFGRIALSPVLLFSALLLSLGVNTLAAAPASAAPCYPPGSTACTGSLSSTQTTITPGGSTTITGSGYTPGTTVTIDVCGLLSVSTVADSSGNISTSVTIPSSAAAGPCAITAVGLGANGKSLSLTTNVTLTSVTQTGSAVPPAHTGEPWASAGYWSAAGGTALVGAGLVALGLSRRRRSKTS
jgi:hypothetical protein